MALPMGDGKISCWNVNGLLHYMILAPNNQECLSLFVWEYDFDIQHTLKFVFKICILYYTEHSPVGSSLMFLLVRLGISFNETTVSLN